MSSEIDFARDINLNVYRVNGIEGLVETIKTFYNEEISKEIYKKCAKLIIPNKNIKIVIFYNENECYYYYVYFHDKLIHTNINICSMTYACSLIMSEIRDLMMC